MFDGVDELKYVIDADQPDAHQLTSKEEVFFQEQFESALQTICQHVSRLNRVPKDKLKNPEKDLPSSEQGLLHRHSTIGVFGPRGVGKTSFLLTVKNLFEDTETSGNLSLDDLDTAGDGFNPSHVQQNTTPLKPVDPSRIENEDKLLVTITSKILDQVRQANDGDLDGKHALQDALEDLSRRFRVLFPDATEEALKKKASDPLRFAGEVLFDADSGPKLAEAFHRFLSLAAHDLGVKCFLLPIDDVDTSFDKGWPVLETLRRYLSTDRLLTVLSGDLELFELIVRQKGHERTEPFRTAEQSYEQDASRRTDLNDKYGLIRRFSGQYLQKIFRAQNRMLLPNIRDVLFQNTSQQVKNLTIYSARQESLLPLQNALLFIARTLYNAPYRRGNENRTQILNSEDTPESSLQALNQALHSSFIELQVPANTRNFALFLEAVYEALQSFLNGSFQPEQMPGEIRRRMAQIQTIPLQQTGFRIQSLKQLSRGEGYYKLARNFYASPLKATYLTNLDAGRIERGPNYNPTRVLLNLAASHVLADWRSNLTGPIRYFIKVKTTLSLIENRNIQPERKESPIEALGGGLQEPSWKSRCRLLRFELSDNWGGPSDYVNFLGTAMRIPRQRRSKYAEAFVNLEESSNYRPDFLRWWNQATEKRKGKFIAKNRALLPDEIFQDNSETHANAVLGMFRTMYRKGRQTHHYVDFQRGLSRIDDFVRSHMPDDDSNSPTPQTIENDRRWIEQLAEESSWFLLQISGDAESQEAEPETIETPVTDFDQADRQRDFRRAVAQWVGLAHSLSEIPAVSRPAGLNSNAINFPPGSNVVPPPWTIIDALDRFVVGSTLMADDTPWRQYSVGTMLERFSMVFWNSLLVEEIDSRAKHEQIPREIVQSLDFGVVRDNRNHVVDFDYTDSEGIEWTKPAFPNNAFTRNVSNLIKSWERNEIEGNSLLDFAPYTFFWMSCPFLLPLVSSEVYDFLVFNTDTSTDDPARQNSLNKRHERGLLEIVYDSTKNMDDSSISTYHQSFIDAFSEILHQDTKGDSRPSWQRTKFKFSNDKYQTFDLHDILCGIARADTPNKSPTSESEELSKEFLD